MEETKVTQAAHEAERKTVRRTMPTQMSRLRVFANSPAPHFESGFGRIAETRMKGLPILNPRIRVKADNFRRWGNDWIGTVTTPWAVIVVYACGCRESWVDVPAGEVRTLELPAGDFPFLGCRDDLLGDYLMLSLVSPVTEFEDQAAAEAEGRMRANREAYEQGLAEERAIRERRGKEDGAERQDRKVKGRVTVSFSITDPVRTSRYLEVPAYLCEGGGDVTVSVTVDRAGKVTGARVTEGGDDCMRESALRAARNSLFNIDDSAPARQTGTITYIFIPQ